MPIKIKFFVFLISVLCFTQFGFAQDVVVIKSNKIETIQGKKYYVHEVKKGETIYSISKAYGVEKNTIALENPEIFEKFDVGQILHIPYIKEKNSDKENIHIVSKGETLYSISKKYNISVNEIIKHNPDAENGLQIGQKLKILNTKTNSELVSISPSDTSSFIMHTVEKGQTLYSISKQYGISIDQIYHENPEIETKGLKVGDVLKIPREKNNHVAIDIPIETSEIDSSKETINNEIKYIPNLSDSDCGKYDYNANKETFKIALILPLQGDAMTIEAEEEASINPNFEPNPKPFLEYYEGFLLAVDSMKKSGLNLLIKTIDLRRDSAKTLDLLSKGEINNVDLIVGPVFETNFKIFAEFAVKNGINIVYPINSKTSELYSNPRVFVLNSSLYSQMAQATRYMASFNTVKYIVIHNNTPEEMDIVKVNKRILYSEYLKNFQSENVPYSEIIYSTEGIAGVEKSLSRENINILVIPSSNQVFVINLLTKLQTLTKKYRIILSGMPSWKKFENNIELEYLYNLNLHTFAPFHTDYTNTDVISFVKDYRDKYKCEPSKFSFLGFDTGIYFLTGLKTYGHEFQNCLQNLNIKQIQSDFNFVKVSEKGGYENNGIYILHYNSDNDVKVVNVVKDSVTLPLIMPDIQIRKVKP